MTPALRPVELNCSLRLNHSLRALAFVLALPLAGCLSSGAGVTRVDPDSTVDLSGRWNDADANRVADALIAECLRDGWAERFASTHAASPVVRLYPVRNRSEDHIADQYFSKRLEAALLHSGRVRVVATLEEAADPRVDRYDQAMFASPATRKPGHMETGSDYVLDGWVVSQGDDTEAASVRAYLVTLELVDATTNEKVWIGEQRIKKLVARE